MKIGFLGNTNNYPFIVASQMKELGCEVVMYIDAPKEEMLSRPEYYSSEINYPYPSWIIEDLRLRKSLYIHLPQLFLRDIIKELNTCDAVILNDYGHRFKNYINPNIPSISMFSGADLEVMADYDAVLKMKLTNKKLKYIPKFFSKKFAYFSVNQLRNGIAKTSLVSYFLEGLIPYGDKFLKEIFNDKPFPRFNHFHVNTKGYSYHPPKHNNPFRIFSLTRFMWKTPFPPGRSVIENKGNDVMIKGIAKFIKLTNAVLDIHFVEKGLHVQETKDLIEDLGFTKMVTWHKEMPFKSLNEHIQNADVVFEQIGTHYISGGLYAMLQGRPVIGNARPEIFDKALGESSPICHVTNDDEVCKWLSELYSNKELVDDIGKKSRAYVLKHFDIKNETIYFKNFIENLITKKK